MKSFRRQERKLTFDLISNFKVPDHSFGFTPYSSSWFGISSTYIYFIQGEKWKFAKGKVTLTPTITFKINLNCLVRTA